MIILSLKIFFWLLVGHALCDYPLQGEHLATTKNWNLPKFLPPRRTETCSSFPDQPWWISMAWHSLIHAGAVAFVTGRIWIGMLEFILHFWIDCEKCAGHTSFKTDQALHVICKIAWVGLMYFAIKKGF